MKFTLEQIQTHVRAAVQSQLYITDGERELGDALDLDSAGCDSLDRMEILFEIEEQLEVDLDDEGLGDCRTVGDLVRLVWGQVEQAPPKACGECHTPIAKFFRPGDAWHPCRDCDGALCEKCCDAKKARAS